MIPKHETSATRYCIKPFISIDITSRKVTSPCCDSWLPGFNAGNIEDSSLWEIWNSHEMQALRKSILDGTFSHCDKERCPYLKSSDIESSEYKLYSADQLKLVLDTETDGMKLEGSVEYLRDLGPWIRQILNGRTVLDILPAKYNLCYDETCNLICPSCRSRRVIHSDGDDFIRRQSIHRKLFGEIEQSGFENVRTFVVTGSGDPFMSRLYRELLFTFDGTNYPLLKFIIMTNGVLLTPDAWASMSKIHKNIETIFISIDAAVRETYEKIRVSGDFERLRENLKYLGDRRRERKFDHFLLSVVVQQKNYRELPLMIDLARQINADKVIFTSLDDWSSWNSEEYRVNAVCDFNHPEYGNFLEIIRNPVFDSPIVDLGNIANHRARSLQSGPKIHS